MRGAGCPPFWHWIWWGRVRPKEAAGWQSQVKPCHIPQHESPTPGPARAPHPRAHLSRTFVSGHCGHPVLRPRGVSAEHPSLSCGCSPRTGRTGSLLPAHQPVLRASGSPRGDAGQRPSRGGGTGPPRELESGAGQAGSWGGAAPACAGGRHCDMQPRRGCSRSNVSPNASPSSRRTAGSWGCSSPGSPGVPRTRLRSVSILSFMFPVSLSRNNLSLGKRN